MNGIEAPNYASVALHECGLSFGLSWEDYRFLARTSLAVIENLPVEMGIYKPESGGAALDIWGKDCLVTIEVNSTVGQISLLRVDLDSTDDDPACLLSLSSTEANWRQLGMLARKELES